jgi:hypothetical protein
MASSMKTRRRGPSGALTESERASLDHMATTPELVKEMIYVLDVDGPLSTERRQFWHMTRATLEGPRIRAASVLPGIDWFTPAGDGYAHPI